MVNLSADTRRKGEVEGCAVADLRVDPDVTSHLFAQLLADFQTPQTCSTLIDLVSFQSFDRLKDTFLVIRFDSHSKVSHTHKDGHIVEA